MKSEVRRRGRRGRIRSAGVAHDADGADAGEEDAEGLADLVVEAGDADFLDDDGVGPAEDVEALAGDIAGDADGQAGAGERMAADEVARQAEGFADGADFVLEEVAERFDQFEAEFGGRPPTLWCGV